MSPNARLSTPPEIPRSSATIVRERDVLRLFGTIGSIKTDNPGEQARQSVLKWVEGQIGSELPETAYNGSEFEQLAGGRYCSAVRLIEQDKDTWAVRVDVPDKDVAQRIWTAEVVVARVSSQHTFLSHRLLLSSPEINPRIEPAAPRFVGDIATTIGLYRGLDQVTSSPWFIRDDADAEELVDSLVDPERQLPHVVISLPEEDPAHKLPCVNGRSLAKATAGLAKIVVLPSAYTWKLTERFGKRLSVFNGATRVYLPGFSDDSNPYSEHELILADRLLEPKGPDSVAATLRKLVASDSVRRLRLGREVVSFATVREMSLEANLKRMKNEGATESEQLTAAQEQIDKLRDDLRKANDAQQWLSDEHQQAEERAVSAEAQLTASSYRIQQLLEQIKARGDNPDENIPLPESWGEFADWCDQNLVGRVLLTPRARREVKAPQYLDVKQAAQCLLWLANEYRERRLKGGDGDLRIPLGEGIKNDRCGADSFKTHWREQSVQVDWHVKNGGNTRDPSRCLRIYYFWDETNMQVVIASMPAHLTTGAS